MELPPLPQEVAAHIGGLLAAGRHAEAAAELRRAGALASAGEIYERIWDFASAAEVARERGDLTEALRLFIAADDLREARLVCAQILDGPEEARRAAARILEKERLWAEAAGLRESLGELAAARDLHRLAGRPLDAARLCEQLGDLREAGLLYEALLLDPRQATIDEKIAAHLGMSRMLSAFARDEEAVRQLQRARRLLGPEDPRLEEVDEQLISGLRRLGLAGPASHLASAGAAPRARPSRARRAGQEGAAPLLGRYAITRLLGAGGAGRVFLAEDLLKKRRVALKLLALPQGASRQARDGYSRFAREARVVRGLRHPGIVEIYEFHESEGLLVMEYLEGGTLADQALPLPEWRARRLLLQLIDGLQAAHFHGIIHRDIKPQNIFLTAAMEARLGDFGVCHLMDLQATQTAGLVGTLAYMSPEQISGGRLSFATDVYSLGVTAFQMATGRLPFSGPDFVGQHLAEQAPAPRSIAPSLSPVWDEICGRALRKDPEARFCSLEELRWCVEQLAGDAALEAGGAGAPSRSNADAPSLSNADAPSRSGFQMDALLAISPHATLHLATDIRLGRKVLIEVYREGLLQGEAGAAHLTWLRGMARHGGPLIQRILRIDLGPPSARVVYEAALFRPAGHRPISRADAAALRSALSGLHRDGLVHGRVKEAVLLHASAPVILLHGHGPLAWPRARATPSPEEDLEQLASLCQDVHG